MRNDSRSLPRSGTLHVEYKPLCMRSSAQPLRRLTAPINAVCEHSINAQLSLICAALVIPVLVFLVLSPRSNLAKGLYSRTDVSKCLAVARSASRPSSISDRGAVCSACPSIVRCSLLVRFPSWRGGINCFREYMVAQSSFQVAVEQKRSGVDAHYLAVPAVPTDKGKAPPPVYLRWSRIERSFDHEELVRRTPQLSVATPDFRAKRVSGATLIAIGLAHFVTGAAVMLADYSSRARPCTPNPAFGYEPCGGGLGGTGIIVGSVMGGLGLLLLIPGTVELARSYRWPPEVPPSQFGIRYLDTPERRPAGALSPRRHTMAQGKSPKPRRPRYKSAPMRHCVWTLVSSWLGWS